MQREAEAPDRFATSTTRGAASVGAPREGATVTPERKFGSPAGAGSPAGGSEHADAGRRFGGEAAPRTFGEHGEGARRPFGDHGGEERARGFGRADMRGPVRDARGRGYFYGRHRYESFRAERYRWPYGYHYRVYRLHEHLPRAFWVPEYYVEDYGGYGLEAPPTGAQWIRYGPDLLLVSLDSGDVLNAVKGAFYESDEAPSEGGEPPPQ